MIYTVFMCGACLHDISTHVAGREMKGLRQWVIVVSQIRKEGVVCANISPGSVVWYPIGCGVSD